MNADGTIRIFTDIDTTGIQSGTRQIESSMDTLAGKIKKIGGLIAAAFTVTKIIEFGKECIELGSDLEEVQNVVDSVFTTMSDKVDEFAKNAAVTAGLSETMAKQYTGTFGAMAKSFGFAEDEAYEMSTALTQLAGDVASFYNITQDEAYTKLKSVFTGETESLKELGVVMTQSALDQYALANGYGKTTSAMTEQEKVALRYRFVTQQLNTAAGDFIRTSDGWANQIRILKLQFDSLKATIGQGLINLFTPVIKVINLVLAKLATVANAFKAFTQLITGQKSSGASSSEGAPDAESYNAAAAGAENLADATKDSTKATKEAQKANKNYLSGLDEIRKLSEETSSPNSENGSAGGSGTSAGATVDYGSLAEGETVIDEVSNSFTELFEKLKSYVEPLSVQLQRFAGIAKDAFGWLMENVLKPLANYTVNELVPRFFQTLANVMEIINNVLIALQPLWQWFWDNVLLPIATWTGGLFLQVWDQINIALKSFADWCAANPEAIQTAAIVVGSFFAAFMIVSLAEKILGIVSAISSFASLVTTLSSVMGVGKTMSMLFGKAVSALSSPFGIAVTVIGLLISAGVLLWKNWDTVKEKAAELRDWVIEKATDLKEKAVAAFEKLAEKVSSAMDTLWTNVKKIWDWVQKKFQIFATWLSGVFEKDWTETFGMLGVPLNTFFDTAKGIIEGIKEIFSGLITFITGVFTGDWSKAWEGVKTIFAGIWETLVTVLKAPINGIIGLLNQAISKINSAISGIESAFSFGPWEIPLPFGSKTIGFSADFPRIKTIPYLAQGAVIPPNAPFMAMLGDQRNGMNLEGPEDMFRKIVREEFAAVGAGGGQYQFTAQINRRTLFDEFIEEAKMRQMQTGRNPFEFG